jgi:predicted TIM-barrel fold metal-dependent hydrolase
MNSTRIISSDSHIIEPPNLWQERMPKEFGDRIPRLGKGERENADDFYVEGQPIGVLFKSHTDAGKRFSNPDEIRLEGEISEIRPGAWEPEPRLKDMDLDGVYSDFIYPSVILHFWSGIQDPILLRGIFAAYNDWLGEFCSAKPERLNGIAQIALDDDIPAGVKELERVAKRGMAGAMISVGPREGERYDSPEYEQFWTAAEEIGLPLSLHIGTSRAASGALGDNRMIKISATAALRTNIEFAVRLSLCELIYSGVLERHPKLPFIQLEHELSWVPFFIDRMEWVYRERPQLTTYRFKNGATPTTFMRNQVYHSFLEDGLGIKLRYEIGVDNLMWGSDYPHVESTWPKSQEILDDILEGVPEDEKQKIVTGNAARLYGIDLN